jgi:Glycosyl hydrolases family 2, TIM barrel domain/Glycosyl hydrolases family 2, sugar binding domain/Glycosyl hydrolases family 2
MERWTRRNFIKGTAQAAAGAAALGPSCGPGAADRAQGEALEPGRQLVVPLDGTWLFRTDPDKRGEALGWPEPAASKDGWDEVPVPSTWQVSEKTAEYMGAAWYRREFEVPAEWKGRVVRVEFEAVFHTASIFVNGRKAGEHVGKGTTAFTLDITDLLRSGGRNTMAVRADNSFAPAMLPRGNSYDWTPDGGITRPVSLIVTPPVYIANVWVDASPDLDKGTASLTVAAVVRNDTDKPAGLDLGFRVVDEATGLSVLEGSGGPAAEIPARTTRQAVLPETVLNRPKLWHFDHPHLYVLEATISHKGRALHRLSTTFGIRKIEVRGTEFLLNGEPVRLAGVERMAGSHPDFGMAEPASWIGHDHDDLKELNCVFTRVHWQQDRRVMDYCDRKGVLIQVEVPTWGPDTFRKLEGDLFERITANGLEQLREVIGRERNHPCVFSWGLCNEVDGQDPAAQEFVRRMLREAKRLDPGRLCSYASNSLQRTPERDVAGEMDFIEWNEYYESWYGGDLEVLRRNLEAIHAAFPGKPVVISEYGYCACTADRPEDDPRRVEILRTHNSVFRDHPWVGGLIFFDYNDYRTHLGDKGAGVLRQRVHGVVDVFGARKPSFQALREESSPVESLKVRKVANAWVAAVRTRKTVPAYPLRGYTLRWVVFGKGGIPLERRGSPLPDLKPGAEFETHLEVGEKDVLRLSVDVLRPTGFSAATVTAEGTAQSRATST